MLQLFSYAISIQVASSALGFGPQMAMQVAERLYTQGFIRFVDVLHRVVDYLHFLLLTGYVEIQTETFSR